MQKVENTRFADLYDRYGDRVFRLSLRLTGGCHAEAEDVAQEAMIAAFGALPRFAGRAQITTWLYAVTVRTWRKHRARREPDSLSLTDSDGVKPTLAFAGTDDINARLTRLTIDAALADLPDTLREAFVLVKSEGLTHREAAALLKLPIGTVQARVHQAARRLRAALSVDE